MPEPEPDFVLHIEIAADRATLHSYLCDLERMAPLHPLIESITELEASAELPRARRWRVVDRVPLGPLRLRAEYIAAIESLSADEVHGHAWQKPGVRLHTIYALSEGLEPGTTRLEERVQVRAPFGLHGIVVRQARAAHTKMLAGMKQLLERGAQAP